MTVWIFGGNSAEGPKFSQNERIQSHLQHIKILARFIQMRNDEEMGSNAQIEAEIWQFGYSGGYWHTKQCRRAKMQPKQTNPKPFTTHKNNHKAHPDEEWWRDGFNCTNRSRDMAVWDFGGWLTHKTVQKGQNAAKTRQCKTFYIAWKYSQGSCRWAMMKRWVQTDE